MSKRSMTSQGAFLRAERDEKVLHLRRTTSMTLQAIGDAVGIDKAEVHTLIKKHVQKIVNREAAEYLAHELDRLQAIENATLETAFGFRAELDSEGNAIYEPLFNAQGQQVRDQDGNPVVVPRQDLNATNAGKAILLRVIQERAKLLGLYTTKIQDVTPIGNSPQTVTFRIVESDGNGRMLTPAATDGHQTIPDDAACNIGATSATEKVVGGVEVVSFDIPSPLPGPPLKYMD